MYTSYHTYVLSPLSACSLSAGATKVAARTPPADIVAEIREVLDDEAEIFVMKMWRVVAYETEFKREGLGEK